MVSDVLSSDGRFPYSKSKIKIFSQNRKKSKSRFYNKLVHRFLLNNRAPSPATREPHVIKHTGEVGGAVEGDCNLIVPASP